MKKAIDDYLEAQPDIRAVTTEQILAAAPKATARQASAIKASRISRMGAAAQTPQTLPGGPPRGDKSPGRTTAEVVSKTAYDAQGAEVVRLRAQVNALQQRIASATPPPANPNPAPQPTVQSLLPPQTHHAAAQGNPNLPAGPGFPQG